MSIKDIKNQFMTQEAFRVYSDCMYKPTWEKFCNRSRELINDTTVSIYGYTKDNKIIGLITIRINEDGTAEIKGIAVDSAFRKQGIGQQLIQFAVDNMHIAELIAETDDDAISFYRYCGFKTEEFYIQVDNCEYKRYKCVLYKM